MAAGTSVVVVGVGVVVVVVVGVVVGGGLGGWVVRARVT